LFLESLLLLAEGLVPSAAHRVAPALHLTIFQRGQDSFPGVLLPVLGLVCPLRFEIQFCFSPTVKAVAARNNGGNGNMNPIGDIDILGEVAKAWVEFVHLFLGKDLQVDSVVYVRKR